MSNVVPALDEREANATLQDAFAFIDAYRDEAPHAYALSWAETGAASVKMEPQDRPVKKKRMEHRERVKGELQRLRTEAEVLEATLLRLQRSPPSFRKAHGLLARSPADVQSFNARGASSESMEVVVREYTRRKASETTNQKLKALLAKQLKAARSPPCAMAHQLSREEIALLSSVTGTATGVIPYTAAADAHFNMAARVNQLEGEMPRLMLSAGLTDHSLQFFRTQRSVNKAVGVTFEIVSSTPLLHSMEATDRVFWRILAADSDSYPTSSPTDFSRTCLSSISILGEQHELDSSAVFRRRATTDCFVYTWSSVAPLTEAGFSVYEDAITTMWRGSGRTCQLQFWHRIHINEPDTNDKRKRLSSFREAVLKQHSQWIERFYRYVTDKLQEEVVDVSIDDLVLRTSTVCPIAAIGKRALQSTC